MKTKTITMLLTFLAVQVASAGQIKHMNTDDGKMLTWEPKPARFVVKKTAVAVENDTSSCAKKASFDPAKSICSGQFHRTANCIVKSSYYMDSFAPNKRGELKLQAGEDYRILKFSSADQLNPENLEGLGFFRSIYETEQEYKARLQNPEENDRLHEDKSPFLQITLGTVGLNKTNQIYVYCRNLTIDSDVEELQRELSGLFRIEQ